MMRVRTKTRLVNLVFLAWAGAILFAPAGPVFLVGFVGTFVALAVASVTIRCPRCGESPYLHRVRAFGEDWHFQGWFARRSCLKCGLDFSTDWTPGNVETTEKTSSDPSRWSMRKTRIALWSVAVTWFLGGILGHSNGQTALSFVAFGAAGLLSLILLFRAQRSPL